jgi:hypothetical protein
MLATGVGRWPSLIEIGWRGSGWLSFQEVEGRGQVTQPIEEVAASIREAVAEHHDIQVQTWRSFAPDASRRRPSGKIQRRAVSDAFLSRLKLALGRALSALDAEGRRTPARRSRVMSMCRETRLLALPVDSNAGSAFDRHPGSSRPPGC